MKPKTQQRMRTVKWFGVLVCLMATLLWAMSAVEANGRKPPAKKSKTEEKPTLKNAKDGTNKALDDLDHGVHKAAKEVKDGANQALQAVDDTLHGRTKN